MSKRLEVGDEVVFDGYYGSYSIETVLSVTGKRAKLSNHTTLIRDLGESKTYTIYGRSYHRGFYKNLTPELKKELEERSKKRDYESKVERWFKDFSPDFATKESLYKQFNPEL